MPVPTLNPDLPEWPGARLFCTTRSGGVSLPPYHSLNLGDHVGDDAQRVAINRQRLAQTWEVHPVFMQQVHGTAVVCIDSLPLNSVPVADACWSTQPGVACTIMVADCLPVLFYKPHARLVAAAHAGWRGLAAGVLENTLQTTGMLADGGAVKVWLGPCIGPQAFEVGEEVLEAFVAVDPHAQQAFQSSARSGKYLCDLAALARQRLQRMGIEQVQGNDSSTLWCTYSNPQLYFSHRRDGRSGRFAAGIALD